MADVPVPHIADVDTERDVTTVYSYFLADRDGPQIDRPHFWTLDLATGEKVPLELEGARAVVQWTCQRAWSPPATHPTVAR